MESLSYVDRRIRSGGGSGNLDGYSPRSGLMLFRHLPSLNRHLALRLALGLALASALPQSVSGQVGLTRGDHVRVRFGNEHAYSFGDREEASISGEVVSTLGGELVLRRSERLTRIPLSDVRSIKKRTGRRAPSVPDMVASATAGCPASNTTPAPLH